MKYVSVEENTQPKTIIFRFIYSWKLFVGLENSDQNLIIRAKIRNFIFTRAVELVEWPFLSAIETCHRQKSAKTCILVESIPFGFVIIGWILLDMLLVVLIKTFGQLKSCLDVFGSAKPQLTAIISFLNVTFWKYLTKEEGVVRCSTYK